MANYLSRLRQQLSTAFNKDELDDLCFGLGIEYEDLKETSLTGQARGLVNYARRHGRFSDLLRHCTQKRPMLSWGAHIFISYKRGCQPDEQLAHQFHDILMSDGHTLFIDQKMLPGTQWVEEIDAQLRRADFLLVLLSKDSLQSEMVKEEIRRAANYFNDRQAPIILPIRVNYHYKYPYPLDEYLNQVQYVMWEGLTDSDRVADAVLKAIAGSLPEELPIWTPVPTTQSPDKFVSPAPMQDPSLLIPREELKDVTGVVQLEDPFYVRREADDRLAKQLQDGGTITTIRASRQTGKTSLLVRGVHQAKEMSSDVVYLDLQATDPRQLVNSDTFLRYWGWLMVRRLRLDRKEFEEAWADDMLGPQDRLTYYLEDVLLPSIKDRLVLAIDEVDGLLVTNFHTPFFGMIRSWFNNTALDPLWKKLNIVLSISTEPFLLIKDVTQSPFNVGEKLYLKDFNESEVADLNERHGRPLNVTNLAIFNDYFGGHPFLTRRGFYLLAGEGLSWADLQTESLEHRGPFGDHLKRILWLLQDDELLVRGMKEGLQNGRCRDKKIFYRLSSAGLLIGEPDQCVARCGLYREYFGKHL